MRKEEKWVEIVHDEDKFKLYTSFGKMEKGMPEFFEMNREELVDFKNKINDALRRSK